MGAPLNHSPYEEGDVVHLGAPFGLTQDPLTPLAEGVAIAWDALENTGVLLMEGAVGTGSGTLTLLVPPPSSPQSLLVNASSAGQTAWGVSQIDTDTQPDVLIFDYEFISGAGGLLSVEFEGNQIFAVPQEFSGTGVQTETIALGGFRPPGTYALAFRLDPTGGTSTEARVSNVRFASVPVEVEVPMMGPVGMVGLMSLLLSLGLAGLSVRRPRAP
jgi:hypothetical protein